MRDNIFIIDNEELIELHESNFINELQFQKLLENYPNLISGNQIEPDNPRKWILISREFGIPKSENSGNIWSLDHLFLDQDGIPTLVEVKRSSDTRIRREVVGQMLDYAANSVSYWSIDDIQNKFEENCHNKGIEPEIIINELTENEKSIDDYWEKVDTNLKAGKIRLLFIADELPKELIRIIEFLNEQMSPAEVLGVEIKQFSNDTIKTLVPRVFGKTSTADSRKGLRQFSHWDDETFYNELGNRSGSDSIIIVKQIIEGLKDKVTRFWYGQGKRSGSIVPIVDKKDYSNQLFAIYTYGKIEVYFQFMKAKPPFNIIEKRIELQKKLNELNLIIPDDKIDKRPSFDITNLKNNNDIISFIKIFEWVIQEINSVQK